MKIESTKPKKEKLTPCPYCGRPLRNERCENCKKDYLSQTAETTPNEMDPTAFLSEDEVVGIKFLNEAKEEAKTKGYLKICGETHDFQVTKTRRAGTSGRSSNPERCEARAESGTTLTRRTFLRESRGGV